MGNNTNIVDEQLMSSEGYAITAIILFLIGFFGFFTNLAVIIMFIKHKQLWTPLNVILFNLVCSDFSVSILGNPVTFTAAVLRGWVFGKTACVAYGFFMSLLGIAAITTLMVLSFERYVMISNPFRAQQLSYSGAILLVVAIWAYSLVVTTPPIFGWGQYVNEAANISCSVNWEHRTHNATSYIVFLFILGLVVPVTVICYSYLNIVCTMKKNATSMGRVSKAETRVAAMVGVMVIAFLVAWLPYSVFALIVAFGDPSIFTPSLAVMPALMAKSSICYNPIIYVGLNTQFRVAWRQLLGFGEAISETSLEFGGQHSAISVPISHDKPSSWRVVLPTVRNQQLETALEKVHLQVSQNGERLELKTVRSTNEMSDRNIKQEHTI